MKAFKFIAVFGMICFSSQAYAAVGCTSAQKDKWTTYVKDYAASQCPFAKNIVSQSMNLLGLCNDTNQGISDGLIIQLDEAVSRCLNSATANPCPNGEANKYDSIVAEFEALPLNPDDLCHNANTIMKEVRELKLVCTITEQSVLQNTRRNVETKTKTIDRLIAECSGGVKTAAKKPVAKLVAKKTQCNYEGKMYDIEDGPTLACWESNNKSLKNNRGADMCKWRCRQRANKGFYWSIVIQSCKPGYNLINSQCVLQGTTPPPASSVPPPPAEEPIASTPPVADNERARRESYMNEVSVEITDIESRIKSIVEKMGEASVWKTAQGTFNWSRFGSDAAAGVVLGTAGGLITSSIIKKNQKENGLEDISCTVGGQVVAGFDDGFRVGVR